MKKKSFLFITIVFILFYLMTTYAADLSANLQIVREIAPVTKKTISETYVDAAGNPTVARDKGYATINYKYNTLNMVTEKRFLDTAGNTVNCTDGYAYVEYEYYLRRVIHTAYFDAAGNPAIGPEGYAVRDVKHGERGIEKEAYEYDAEGKLLMHCVTEYIDEKHNNRIKSKTWYDAHDQLTAGSEGYARVSYEYLNKKKIHIAYYNADGSLFYNKKDGYAEFEQTYDKNKRLVEEVYRRGQDELIAGPKGYARVTYEYLQGGKECLTMYYNADGSLFFTEGGYCGIRQYQKNAKIVDEQYYVGEGIRGNCKDGYSRTEIRYNNYKQITTQSYYDEHDNLVCPEGYVYSKVKNTYTGRFIVKTEYFGTDEKHVLGPDGYAVVAYKYKKQRISEESYYAEDGKTPINGKNGYAKVKYQYDNKKMCISEAYYDVDGTRKAVNGEANELRFGWNNSRKKISESYWRSDQPVNCEKGYHEIRTEYTSNNKLKKESYYDINGNHVVSADGYAEKEILYNSNKREMATLYYDEDGNLIKTPGKEYAYLLTIPEKDKKVLSEENAELADETEPDEEEENNPASIVYIEYYDTERKLMNLSSGYAYSIRETDFQGRIIRERYYDKDGNKAVLKYGYDEYRQEYINGKKPSRIEYYRNGNLALYNESHAAVEREYDVEGNISAERYYDTDIRPASCINGYEMIRKEYNEKKQVIKEEYFDHNGQSMTNKKGVYQTSYEYNENGKIIKETYSDSESNPMICTDGYAGYEKIYNEQGVSVASLYYDEAGQLMLAPGKEYAYNVTTLIEDADEENNAIKTNYIEYYGTDRQPMNLSSGYSSVIRKTDKQERIVGEVYFDKDGNKAVQKGEYDEIRQEYTDKKKPSRIEYYLNGRPVLRSDGYAAIEREYDEDGFVITEKYYDVELQPTSCNKGYEMIRKEYNVNKRVSKEEYYNHIGQPMKNKKGVYQTAYEYDDGRNIRETYFDADGMPMLCSEGYAGIGKMYNNLGGTMATLYFSIDGNLVLAPGKEYAYVVTVPKSERDGTKEEEKSATKGIYIEYYDTDRKLINTSSGYAVILRTTDVQGRTISEVYFDKNGQRTVRNNTFDEVRNLYTDDKKVPYRMEYYKDNEPVLRTEGYAALEREYDEDGNVIVEKYYDANFNPTKRNGYEMIQRVYNGDKQVIKETYYDNAGNPIVSSKGIYQAKYEYNEQGKVVREAYFDTEEQPMSNNNGYIMIERTYNEEGKKITETSYTAESLK